MLPHVAPCVASCEGHKHPCSAEHKSPSPKPCAETCGDAKPNGLDGTFDGNEMSRNSPQSRAAEVRRRCRTLRPVSRFVGRGGIPAPAGGKIDCPELCGATCKRTEAAILMT